MMKIAHTTDERAALRVGHGEEAHEDVRQAGGAEHERDPERDRVDRARQERARARARTSTRRSCSRSARLNSSIGLKPTRSSTNIDMTKIADHQQDGLDDLHPRRGEHPAEDDVAEHHHAGDQHGDREVDADERLDEHARADHLRDEVEGRDRQRAQSPPRCAPGARAAGRTSTSAIVYLPAFRIRSASRNITVRNATRKPTEYRKPSKPKMKIRPGDAEERRRRQVVAGDREAVLDAADRAAGGPEDVGAGHPLGGPVGDDERDRQDDREDHERLDVGGGDDRSSRRRPPARAPGQRAGRPRCGVAPVADARCATTFSASGSYTRSERRRYMSPSATTMTNCVSARQ